MKKIIAVALALLCVLGVLAGCSKNETPDPTITDETGDDKIPVTDSQTKYYDIPVNDKLKYDIDFDEYLVLPDFSKMEVDYNVMEKDEKTIADQIYNLQLQTAKKTEVTDRAAAEGDVVIIDYSSVLYGTDTKVAETNDVEITIGRDNHDIPELDDNIIGMKKGETRQIDLVYPANYTKKPELASTKITATVTLDSIMTAVLPELNAETIKSFGFGDSVYNEATLKEFIKLWIDEQNLQRKKDAIYNQTLKQTQILAYPKTEYTYYEEEFDANEKNKAENLYKVSLESYVDTEYGGTEEYNSARTAYAEKYTTEDLILYALSEKYGVKVTTESFNDAFNNFFTQNAQSVGIDNTDDFYNYMGVSIYRTHLLDLVFTAVAKDVQ